MKIGLVNHEYPPDVLGGVSLHNAMLARGLAARGHTVHVITLSTGAPATQVEEGVTVHRVLHRSLYPQKGRLRESLRRIEYSLSVMGKIRELLGSRELDLIQAHPMGADLFLYSLQTHFYVPVVTHLSTIYRDLASCEDWAPNADLTLSTWMEDEIIMRSQALIAPSASCAAQVAQRLGIDAGGIDVVPHGIPLPELRRKETRGKSGGSHVLFVGRLERRKGVHNLIQAIPEVLRQAPNATFSIMGADSYAGSAELGRDGNANTSFKQQLLLDLPHAHWPKVQFLGACTDAIRERALEGCDIFVAPSLHESFGFIYLEAMACARPVIGCRVGGVPEVVEDNQTGMLIPPEDPKALAAALVCLLRDAPLRRRMGKAGREAVEQRFTADKMVERTEAVYERLLIPA